MPSDNHQALPNPTPILRNGPDRVLLEFATVANGERPRDAIALNELQNLELIQFGELSHVSLTPDGLRVWAALKDKFVEVT